jgi:alpha-glucosidase
MQEEIDLVSTERDIFLLNESNMCVKHRRRQRLGKGQGMNPLQGTRARWWQTGVVYQIYPRSFMDSNGNGVGDLKGIISKLDYLNDGTEKSLGVDAIWLSPIYPSPNKDFGYDIRDYGDIDPLYGDMDDFKLLLRAAHDRNIRIVMDLVINPTSDQQPWFIEACRSRDNPYHDWYLWHEGNNGKVPNNWFAYFDKKAWWWVDEVRKFYLSTWCRYQPEVNWRNPNLKEAMFDVIRFWLDLGVDGYRIDVINWFLKDEHFRSNPFRLQLGPPDYQKHIYDRNRPEIHDLCREIRRVVDAFPDRFAVGEVYTKSVKDAAAYYGNGDELHLAFNFAFLFQKWGAANFLREIEKWDGVLTDRGWPTYTLSNHDQPRHYGRYAKGDDTDRRARVAAAMLLTLRGTPFLYYGEEIGMSNRKIARKQIQDPMGKKYWPLLKGRDPERTPMQWNGSRHAGFSTVEPWLPIHPNHTVVNVENQADDSGSLLSFYRALIWLRKKTAALNQGTYRSLVSGPTDCLAYLRSHEGQVVLVLLNFVGKRVFFTLPGSGSEPLQGRWKVRFGTDREKDIPLALSRGIDLNGYEVLILEREGGM